MNRVGLVLMAVFVLAASSPAFATDFCIESRPTGSLVGKGFTLPLTNKCKPFHGFGDGGIAVGTACRTADGSIVRLHYTVRRAATNFNVSGACNFRMPLSCSDIDRCNCWATTIYEVTPGNNTIFNYPPDAATAGNCLAGQANVP